MGDGLLKIFKEAEFVIFILNVASRLVLLWTPI